MPSLGARWLGRTFVLSWVVACGPADGGEARDVATGPVTAVAPDPGSGSVSSGTTAAAAAEAAPGVLLITLDTTRADRLGAYDASRELTPRLDALAAGGLVFEQARTTNPLTLPAHTSMLTGTYPMAHGVRDNGIFRVDEESLLLAEVLAARGFRTAAAIGALVLDARYGLAQGFETYATPPVRRLGQPLRGAARPADEVVDDALAWMDGVRDDEPVFLWVHLFDAHFPWEPPEPYRSLSDSPYDGEVAFMDAQIGRLLDAWNAEPARPSLVIVAGDHGEGLGEHGESVHGVFVYDSTMHVPMIVAGSGVPAGRIAEPVSVADVAPTVLDWLRLPADLLPDSGTPSLLETARRAARGDRALAERPLPLESLMVWHEHGWHPVRGLSWRGFKYVDTRRPELYDLSADPHELDDLVASQPERAEAMRRRLAELDAASVPLDWSRRTVPDTATLATLRSLGYAGSGDNPGGDGLPPIGADLPDAKDRLADLGRRDEALWLLWNGRRLMGFDGVLAEVPRPPRGTREAERHERGRLQLTDARAILQDLHADSPGDPELALYLGVVELALDHPVEAVQLFEQVVAHRPRAADAHFDLAAAREQAGDPVGAHRAMTRALELEPRALRASLWMAEWHARRTEPQHAAWWLERLLGPDPIPPDESDDEVRAVAAMLEEMRRQAASRGLEVVAP